MIGLIGTNREQLLELCRTFRVKRLDLFGSAVAGQFVPGTSDLDFLVVFDARSPAEHADCYFGLLDALESLFGCPVDLLEASAITNPYLRQAIEAQRELLYAA